MRRQAQGFTLIELLITLAIFTVILGVLSAFFTSQLRFSQLTKARADVQDKVRFLMAIATQDLQLAGSSKYVTDTTTNAGLQIQTVNPVSAFGYCGSGSISCLTSAVTTGTSATSGVRDTLAVRYVTSLRTAATSCRTVQFTYPSATSLILQRSDVNCGQNVAPQELATGVLAFNILYLCSNGTSTSNPTACTASFPRAARVTVYAQSDRAVSGQPGLYDVEGTVVSCPANSVCFGMQQEVVMPNMKDK